MSVCMYVFLCVYVCTYEGVRGIMVTFVDPSSNAG